MVFDVFMMQYKFKDKKKCIDFSLGNLNLSLDIDKNIFLKELNFIKNINNELFSIKVENKLIPKNKYKIETVSKNTNVNFTFISIDFSQNFENDFFKGRISFVHKKKNIIDFIFQLSVRWHKDIPKKVLLKFPFLINLHKNKNFLKPGDIFDGKKRINKGVWNLHEYPPSIISNNLGNQCLGFEFYDQFPWQANYNLGISEAISNENFEKLETEVQLTRELTDIILMKIYTSSQGREKIFGLWKENTRERYDLRKYHDVKNRWIKKNYLQHFMFAYGEEAFDYKKIEFKINQIIKEGKEFGGYDSILFWHQYPRLGLDESTQWQLYKYLPKNYKTIKKIVHICHAHNIKFFIPFKPWDIRSNESLDSHAKFLEKFIKETSIDGFFLDTMSSLPESFLKIQKKFPSFEFCSEGTPKEQRQIESLTSSWDQIGDIRRNFRVDVNSNFFRFLFPEHPLNLVSRWSVGSDKDALIKRAAFNGMGMVIWQDIFGSWLPFSAQQKKKIKSLKNILSKYHKSFFGDNSIPLIPTLSKKIICNTFSDSSSTQKIYSIYNFGSNRINGRILKLPSAINKFKQIFGKNGDIKIEKKRNNFYLLANLEANEVILVSIKFNI